MIKKIIKPDAAPIDNVTKFAWADEDYMEMEFPDPPKPKHHPTIEDRLSDIELAIADLYGGAM